MFEIKIGGWKLSFLYFQIMWRREDGKSIMASGHQKKGERRCTRFRISGRIIPRMSVKW